MKIVMFTNTYLPHVGGVAKSVLQLSRDCREQGHEVRIVAPEFPDMPKDETQVIRVPAIQNFNGSDFSVSLPAPIKLTEELDAFQPDIIHAHHPYLLGDTALRVSATRNLPLVFTYHTMYEHYTHYVPTDSPPMKRFAIELASGFANLCDHIIAPSESVASILRERDVTTPMSAIPTGVDYQTFASGDGTSVRKYHHIPDNAFVVGHIGRLAPEKNLAFLAQAVARFLSREAKAHFLLVGDGPSVDEMKAMFSEAEVAERVHFAGIQQGPDLLDCYHAMNLFVFASKTETQGMVLAEAMAAGVPVIALDAPGAREIVDDGHNGRLLMSEDISQFVNVLSETTQLPPSRSQQWQQAALQTAQAFSRQRSMKRVLDVYHDVLTRTRRSRHLDDGGWEALLRRAKQEWEIWANRLSAGAEALNQLAQAAEPQVYHTRKES